MNEVLGVTDLKRAFTQGEATINVLRGVALSLQAGEIVGLLGPSGAGKSTLLQAVGLLEGGVRGQHPHSRRGGRRAQRSSAHRFAA